MKTGNKQRGAGTGDGLLRALLLGLLAIAGGCRGPQPVDRESAVSSMAIPDRFAAYTGDAGDAVTLTGGLPVDEMRPHLDELLSNNFDLGVAMTRVEGALARAEIAGADLYPGINASIAGSKTQQNFIGLPIPGQSGPLSAQFESYNFSLSTQWELDLWGRVRSARDAARLDATAFQTDQEWIRRSLVSAYMQSWVGGQTALESSRINQMIATNRLDISRILENRFASGLVNADRLRSARNAHESAETASLQALQTSRDSLRSMEKLLGRYPSGTIELPGELPPIPDPLDPGLPSDLMATRPDILAAQSRLEAAGKRVRQSFADLFPRISLTGSTGTASDQLSDLTDLDFSVWSFGGNMARPILDYGRLRAALDLSKSQEREALQNYLSVLQTAFEEVETALDTESTLRESIRLVEDSMVRSRAQAESAREKYRLGVSDRQAVLEAEYLLLLEQQRLLGFKQQFFLNRTRLAKAIGAPFPYSEDFRMAAGQPQPSTLQDPQ